MRRPGDYPPGCVRPGLLHHLLRRGELTALGLEASLPSHRKLLVHNLVDLDIAQLNRDVARQFGRGPHPVDEPAP